MLVFLLLAQVDSLSLNQALERALAISPLYYESKASLDKTRIQFYQTFANLLPTVSASGTYTKSDYQGFVSDGYTGTLTMSQPLFDLDIVSAIFISNRQLKGKKIQHTSDIAQLILRLKTAYYNLVNAHELLKSSEIAIQSAQENLKLVETKYELGAASRLEMLQGEVFSLRAQQDRAKARTVYIAAQEELKALCGVEHDIFPLDTLIPPDSMQFPALDSLAAILHNVNYNIMIAQELRNAAKLDLIASYLAFLPKVSFFYGYTFNADSLVFDVQYFKDNSVKNYGISVAFPIFEIKSLVFNYLSAKKELEVQEFAKKKVLLETRKSLHATYYSLIESYDRLRFAQRSLEAATEAVAIAREQYGLGVLSFLDFLTAEKDLYDSRVSYTSALSEFYIQRANVSFIVGDLTLMKEQ